MKFMKKVAVAAATLSVSAGTVVLAATPGHAYTACTPTACGYQGQSPTATGCDQGAYAVGNAHSLANTGPTGNLHLMYSPNCNTNWVEADGLVLVSDIVVWNQHGGYESAANIPGGSWGYTKMINGSFDAGGCLADDRNFQCIAQGQISTYPPYGSY